MEKPFRGVFSIVNLFPNIGAHLAMGRVEAESQVS